MCYWHFLSRSYFLFQLYQPLNLYIALVGLEIWNKKDSFFIDKMNAESTLKRFLHYRMKRINPTIPNDNAQLLVWVIYTCFSFHLLKKTKRLCFIVFSLCSKEIEQNKSVEIRVKSDLGLQFLLVASRLQKEMDFRTPFLYCHRGQSQTHKLCLSSFLSWLINTFLWPKERPNDSKNSGDPVTIMPVESGQNSLDKTSILQIVPSRTTMFLS